MRRGNRAKLEKRSLNQPGIARQKAGKEEGLPPSAAALRIGIHHGNAGKRIYALLLYTALLTATGSDKDVASPWRVSLTEHVTTTPLVFQYLNWRGERATRRVHPKRVWYGSTEWHPEPQWFLEATDLEKEEVRDFAFKDMIFTDA